MKKKKSDAWVHDMRKGHLQNIKTSNSAHNAWDICPMCFFFARNLLLFSYALSRSLSLCRSSIAFPFCSAFTSTAPSSHLTHPCLYFNSTCLPFYSILRSPPSSYVLLFFRLRNIVLTCTNLRRLNLVIRYGLQT